ncbi:GNAT family N-acetyltransferase [Natrialbaceae archaeon A-arb3/5]
MTLAVRPATTDDVWAVHETARASWHAAYDDVLGSDMVDEIVDDWYAIGDLESSIDDASRRHNVAFVLVDPGDESTDGVFADGCRGFAHVVPWPEDSSVAYLAQLYVRPDSWREGVATTLLDRLEAEFDDSFDRFRIAVLADNDVGVSFVESSGFERVERRKTGFSSALEEYVYEKRIRP